MSLHGQGFNVVTACHGHEALKQFKAYYGNFMAIVTDDDMPRMGGLSLVRNVRKLGFGGRIFVISGNHRPEVAKKYVGERIAGFLKKPFISSTLVAMILEEI